MNFIAQESAEKLRGGFYTEPDIADFLTRWVLEKKPGSILEPSCGDGAFIAAVAHRKPASLRRLCAVELDPVEAAKARERFTSAAGSQLELHNEDFLRWYLFNSDMPRFDAVLGNPPFIRYQYLPEVQQELAQRLFSRFGLPFTKHTNAWVPFVVAGVALLNPGGRLAMVVPSEIFHVAHAQSLRAFLAEKCARVLILDPEDIWFDGTQQGVVLLLAEKKTTPSDGSGIATIPVSNRLALTEIVEGQFEHVDYIDLSTLSGKWMPVFLSKAERSLLSALSHDQHFARFKQLASVDVGIVTGANKFFLVDDDIVRAFELEPWAHPMFGRSEHVQGVIFGEEDLKANRAAGMPTNFLWFDDKPLSAFPPRAQDYLRSGEAEGLHSRYKCRVREPWYRVPSVFATPVAMLKRAHHYPRLILNQARCFTTDTAYRIQCLAGSPISLVYSFLNSLTCLCAELEGRHYGGGVLELVPSEIERLLLPIGEADESDLLKFDHQIRRSVMDGEVVRQHNRTVLARAGLSESDQDTLHAAWDRLRIRRQRRTGDDAEP